MNNKQARQRYTRRHRNSPNYAKWYEVVNWISWFTFILGFVLFIVGLGLLGSNDPQVYNTDATIVWAVGLGVSVLSIILCFALMYIDAEYESQVQSQMMNNVANISPEEWKNLGNRMASMAAAYQQANKVANSNNNIEQKPTNKSK